MFKSLGILNAAVHSRRSGYEYVDWQVKNCTGMDGGNQITALQTQIKMIQSSRSSLSFMAVQYVRPSGMSDVFDRNVCRSLPLCKAICNMQSESHPDLKDGEDSSGGRIGKSIGAEIGVRDLIGITR